MIRTYHQARAPVPCIGQARQNIIDKRAADGHHCLQAAAGNFELIGREAGGTLLALIRVPRPAANTTAFSIVIPANACCAHPHTGEYMKEYSSKEFVASEPNATS